MPPIPVKRQPVEGKPLTVRIDASLDRRLQAAATREGVSVSDFVREAITERLDRGAVECSSSLWERIAPSVVSSRRAASPPQVSKRSGQAARTTTVGRKRDRGTHAEFAEGLEAEADATWRRVDAE
jgi:Ribbon-helix-helix protein, copG family